MLEASPRGVCLEGAAGMGVHKASARDCWIGISHERGEFCRVRV
jgi:hypothetical protein